MAVPEAREAYGRFPCDRHRDRSELELMFGDTVDFSLCGVKVGDATGSACRPRAMITNSFYNVKNPVGVFRLL